MSEWKLVPAEPTEEMVKAGGGLSLCSTVAARFAYKAMLAVAPEHKWVGSSERAPKESECDEAGMVWVCDVDAGAVFVEELDNAKHWHYWMPKPRVSPPQPPSRG